MNILLCIIFHFYQKYPVYKRTCIVNEWIELASLVSVSIMFMEHNENADGSYHILQGMSVLVIHHSMFV